MDKDLISIIVPIYNVEKYLEECLKSIINQTYKNLEIILVNDGSLDNSPSIMKKYESDERVKCFHKRNGGLSDARNYGIARASGTYISFVDSDDYIEKDMIEALYVACIENNVKLSVCGRYDVYDQKITRAFTLDKPELWSSEIAIRNLLLWKSIDSAACDKLFKKELFNQICFPVGKYNEDVFIMGEIIKNAGKVIHIGEPKYYYRHRKGSITKEGFSEKKMSLLEAVIQQVEFINKYYPKLKEEVDSYYHKGLIFLLTLFVTKDSKKKYNVEYTKLRFLLKQSFYSIMKNRYVSVKLKMISLLLLIRVFSTLSQLKSLMRNLNVEK